jgi:hypothetical protein
MAYARVTPRARQGTTGINVEADVEAGAGVWINPPDRVAAVSVAVHIPEGETASYTVEICCNRPETIGEDGTGGYWDDVYGVAQTESRTVMIANAVTGIRVNCLTAESSINVAFCG